MYSFAAPESRLADGSAANHTGVRTPSPLLRNVSRFRYLWPLRDANPVGELMAISMRAAAAWTQKNGTDTVVCPIWRGQESAVCFRVTRAATCGRRSLLRQT